MLSNITIEADEVISDGRCFASFIEAVEHKKNNNETIKEDWLALARDAIMCQERQEKFLQALVEKDIMTAETKQQIHAELFSGKYNHDMIFTPQQLINLGLNITLMDELPSKIMTYFDSR